jgi:hypothetical protein
MFTTVQTSTKPSIKRARVFGFFTIDPGTIQSGGTETFITNSSTSKKYHVLKARHDGAYFIGLKLLLALWLIWLIIDGLLAIRFGVANIRRDYHLITIYQQVQSHTVYARDCSYTSPQILCSYNMSDHYSVPKEVMASYTDKWTWVKNIARGALALLGAAYAVVSGGQLSSLIPVLYRDVRTKFARLDTSIVKRVDLQGKYWMNFMSSLGDKAAQPERSPETAAKRSALVETLKQLVKSVTGTRRIQAEQLVNRAGQLETQPVTAWQVKDQLQALLHEDTPTENGVVCDAAVSSFFVNIDRLVAEKVGANAGQQAKLDATIAALMDDTTEKLTPKLVAAIDQQRFDDIVADADAQFDMVCAEEIKDKRVNGLIASYDYLLTQT